LSDLAPDTYTVTVSDADGQSIMQSYTIAAATQDCPMTIANLVTSDNNGFGVPCNGDCNGSITVEIVSGVEPLTYMWDSGENTQAITNLCAGTYTVTIMDGNGNVTTFSEVITEPQSPLTAIINTTELSSADAMDGIATAVVSGGTAPYTYEWNVSSENDSIITNLGRGLVMVLVTDANGCEFLVQGNIEGGADCYIGREVITPNGDGANDELVIACVANDPNTLQIFDRWGQIVFEQDNYSNTWMATDNSGAIVPDGSYFWVLTVTQTDGRQRIHKGHVTVIRTLD
ncbi:MAG: gliding motility-associated C-terminal domain-containing protein, partial [Bacteroidota bacterium]